MALVTLGELTIEVDVERTRRLYQGAPPPDPQCCNACATLLFVIEREALPPILLDFMSQVGINPGRPVEAWGVPDGGFLQVWWEFVGDIASSALADEGESVEIEPGVVCRVTADHPPSNWAVSHSMRLPAIELTWEGDAVKAFERQAWT